MAERSHTVPTRDALSVDPTCAGRNSDDAEALTRDCAATAEAACRLNTDAIRQELAAFRAAHSHLIGPDSARSTPALEKWARVAFRAFWQNTHFDDPEEAFGYVGDDWRRVVRAVYAAILTDNALQKPDFIDFDPRSDSVFQLIAYARAATENATRFARGGGRMQTAGDACRRIADDLGAALRPFESLGPIDLKAFVGDGDRS